MRINIEYQFRLPMLNLDINIPAIINTIPRDHLLFNVMIVEVDSIISLQDIVRIVVRDDTRNESSVLKISNDK